MTNQATSNTCYIAILNPKSTKTDEMNTSGKYLYLESIQFLASGKLHSASINRRKQIHVFAER